MIMPLQVSTCAACQLVRIKILVKFVFFGRLCRFELASPYFGKISLNLVPPCLRYCRVVFGTQSIDLVFYFLFWYDHIFAPFFYSFLNF